jgi:tetratricopeptide (TPR) repeat protein
VRDSVVACEANKADNCCQAAIDAVRVAGNDSGEMSPEESPAAGETIGQRLKRLRLERGFSQRELAAPGVSYAYISRIEAGTRQPSVKALRRLAAKLSVTADYLETGSDLDVEAARELRLTDLELAVRLGEAEGAESGLEELAAEAAAGGDRRSLRRAHVALAALAQERGEHGASVALLETALRDEPFDPVGLADIYAQLARSYHAAGKPYAAVELFERCLDEITEGDDPTLEARYATSLSYFLADVGDIARAEQVVQRAIERASDIEDPYMRVRLYWSLARLAYREGRSTAALENVRKAIALLQLTDDTLHLARANVLAASISLSREDADTASTHLDQAEQLFGPAPAVDDLFELHVRRSRIATLRGQADDAVRLARQAVGVNRDHSAADDGHAYGALGDALALAGETEEANDSYQVAVNRFEEQSRWREAANTCRSWARMLRQVGREQQALDVLDRAAELATRATPADARVER